MLWRMHFTIFSHKTSLDPSLLGSFRSKPSQVSYKVIGLISKVLLAYSDPVFCATSRHPEVPQINPPKSIPHLCPAHSETWVQSWAALPWENGLFNTSFAAEQFNRFCSCHPVRIPVIGLICFFIKDQHREALYLFILACVYYMPCLCLS